MTTNRRLQFLNGRGVTNPISEFRSLGNLSAMDPEIPNLPLESIVPPIPDGKQNFTKVYGKAYAQSLRTWTQSPFIGNIPQPVQDPFRQSDWPNPKGPRYALQLRTWLQVPYIGDIPPAPVPFRKTDWPNPLRPVRPTQSITGQGRNLSAILASIPFTPKLWPAPRKPTQPLRTFAFNSLALQAAASTLPFQNFAWTLSSPKRGIIANQVSNLLLTTLAITPIPPVDTPDCGHLYPSQPTSGNLGQSGPLSASIRGHSITAGSLRGARATSPSLRPSSPSSGKITPGELC